MASKAVPHLFRRSCQLHPDYPTQLVDRPRYGLPFLRRCQDRLKEQEKQLDLFVPDSRLFVPYLDVFSDGTVDIKNIKLETELETWLGDNFQPDPNDPANRVIGAKPDIPCRFIFLLTASTNKPLEVTSKALRRILTYYQVMPAFLDFLYIYGSKNGDDREIVRFSGFRTEKTLTDPRPALQINELNRSGKGYQMCYSFKSVTLKSKSDDPKAIRNKTWKIRQAVFYHRFDTEKATQLWITSDPLEEIQEIVHEHIHPHKNHKARYETFAQAFKATLDMHLKNAQWATEEWRWHVQSSEEIMDNMTRHFVAIQNSEALIRWEPGALNITQEREEKIKDTLMALESNVAVKKQLRSFYQDLVKDDDFPAAERDTAKRNVREFVSRLDEYIYDINLQITRAQLAAQLAKERKEILIQHLNAQNVTKQAAYTHTMWQQAKKSGIDAVIMKIITVIAVVYLPATFVATFFSSNVVKYLDTPSDSDSNSSTGGKPQPAEQVSSLALERFFEISIPMMLLTLGLAYGWYKWERRHIDDKDGPFVEEKSIV